MWRPCTVAIHAPSPPPLVTTLSADGRIVCCACMCMCVCLMSHVDRHARLHSRCVYPGTSEQLEGDVPWIQKFKSRQGCFSSKGAVLEMAQGLVLVSV
ncbi:hypothetical protein LY76DRAFT_155591 [Colletotrichum caudatum]|nr:hypothetical protein LY76DRAFT_155591 [Colletotrichum caudatum]